MLRDELEQDREQHVQALEENARLRSQVRRQEAQIERLRRLIPDVNDHLAESDSDELEMVHDEQGVEVEIEPDEPVIDDEMDLSEQGSEDYEESSEHDDDDDEDYNVDAESDDSSDGSDGDSGDYLVPETG